MVKKKEEVEAIKKIEQSIKKTPKNKTPGWMKFRPKEFIIGFVIIVLAITAYTTWQENQGWTKEKLCLDTGWNETIFNPTTQQIMHGGTCPSGFTNIQIAHDKELNTDVLKADCVGTETSIQRYCVQRIDTWRYTRE